MRSHADYDLLIIGTGSAGTAAAVRAAELGATVAIADHSDVLGGTCVNVGCIPSKTLIEIATHYRLARSGFPGIAACHPPLAWEEVLRRKHEVIDHVRRERYHDVLRAYDSVAVLRGHASLAGAGRVHVGGQDIRARSVVIATGSRPVVPPIPGLSDAGALDSTSAMELARLPESLVVIGGGSTGLELGQAFSRFGARVTVMEMLDHILPGEDAEISEALATALAAEGMEVRTGAHVTRVQRTPRGYHVAVESGGATEVIEAEQVLVATGRAPTSEGLGLALAGVATDQRGHVLVDEVMRTSNPAVFAAGDVTGGPAFVYVAALQGGIAAAAALAGLTGEQPIPIDLGTLPRVTFTDPQVASVGLTEAAARGAGLAPRVTSLPIRHLPRAVVSFRDRGLIKLVSDAHTDRLLGVHVLAPNAGDVIGEATLAVRFGLTTRDIVSTLHPYLTWAEGLRLAAQTFTKDVAKLSCCA